MANKGLKIRLRHSLRIKNTSLVQYWREMSLTLSSYHVKIYPSFSSASPFVKKRTALGPPQSAKSRSMRSTQSCLYARIGARWIKTSIPLVGIKRIPDIGPTSAAGVAPRAMSFLVTHLARLEASQRHTLPDGATEMCPSFKVAAAGASCRQETI